MQVTAVCPVGPHEFTYEKMTSPRIYCSHEHAWAAAWLRRKARENADPVYLASRRQRDRARQMVPCRTPGCPNLAWRTSKSPAPRCAQCAARAARHGEGCQCHPAPRDCAWCGKTFTPSQTTMSKARRVGGLHALVCGSGCAAKLSAKMRGLVVDPDRNLHGRYRRAVSGLTVRQAAAARIATLNRDGWVCMMEICLAPARRIDRAERYPSPWYGSVDHIVPLNPGHGIWGTDEEVNRRAAHLLCNCSRGNRLPDPMPLLGWTAQPFPPRPAAVRIRKPKPAKVPREPTYPAEKIRQAQELYASGLVWREVAETMGLSINQAYYCGVVLPLKAVA